MSKDVQLFNNFLGHMFPEFTDVVAKIRDRSVIMSILTRLLESETVLLATIPVGKATKKMLEMRIEGPTVALVDIKSKMAYRVGSPIGIMLARFPRHPAHNFVRVKYNGIIDSEDKKKRLVKRDGDPSDDEIKIKTMENTGWFILYPAGSLLSDQRLEKPIRDLVLSGQESAMFSEFIAVVDGEMDKSHDIELVDYQPENQKLWEQWLTKIDTDLFQTIVRPRNFSASSGRSEDYYLKLIKYGDMKIGAVWFEKINQRTATAELGLIIGEPHLWGMGIGSKAVNAMIAIAKSDLGLNFIWVSVREANHRAVNCFSRGGFSIVRRVPVFNKTDGSYQMWVHMEKMI